MKGLKKLNGMFVEGSVEVKSVMELNGYENEDEFYGDIEEIAYEEGFRGVEDYLEYISDPNYICR